MCENDYKILKYINSFTSLQHIELLKVFPNEEFCTTARVKVLRQEKFVEKFPQVKVIGVQNKADYYVVTELGKKAIQDYETNATHLKRQFVMSILKTFLFSIVCPIFVAFVTTLITLLLEKHFK